jgi:LysR family transcriptional regulator, carnitine catabolism transcriptional activator
MPITLRRLRSFIGVAELGSFRRAAERLSISQPALSVHVQELEDELGIALLRRTTREVHLTEEGARFAAQIKRKLVEFDALIDDLKDQAAIQRGRVEIACVPSIASQVLPHILSQFKSDHPKVTVHIHDDRAEIIERLVGDSDVDFAISPPPVRNAELIFEHVLDDPYVAVMPRGHPLAGQSSVTAEALLKYPLIMMRSGLGIRQVFDEALSALPAKPKPLYEVYHHDTLVGFVTANLGVGAMPAMTLANVGHPSLTFAQITDPVISRQIGFLKRRGEQLNPAARRFAEAARRYMRSQAFFPVGRVERTGGRQR